MPRLYSTASPIFIRTIKDKSTFRSFIFRASFVFAKDLQIRGNQANSSKKSDTFAISSTIETENMGFGEKKLFLLDAMSLIFRAFYALNKTPRINSKGLNTSAIFGFTNTLFEVLRTEQPTHIAVAFDSYGPTVRHVEFNQYKAHRDNTPEDIITAIPYIKAILEGFNIPILELVGYEADDIIGTFAKKAEQEGLQTFMMTTDKDYGQLVSENIFVYKPARMGKGHSIEGVKEVCEKYNIKEPTQLIDILGLWGDAVDNIPGIKGIGEVGAKKLIGEYQSIENLIAKSDSIKNEKLKIKVKEGAEDALLSKRLATIILDVPIEFNEKTLRYCDPNTEKLRALFNELEFRTLSMRILDNLEAKFPSPIKTPSPAQTDLFSGLFPQEESVTKTSESTGFFQTFNPQQQHYHLIDSKEKAWNLAAKMQTLSSFCFDVETTGLDPFKDELLGLAISFKKEEAYYVALPNNRQEAKNYLAAFPDLFSDEKIVKIAQNLKFGLKILQNYGIEIKGENFDTMVAHYVIEPETRHHLEALANFYLNYEMIQYEDIADKTTGLKNLRIEKLKDYACEKADITFQLKEKLEKQLEQSNAAELFCHIEMPLVNVLARMENRGVKIDTAFLNQYAITLQKSIEEIKKDIYSLAGEEFNIASPKQLGVILFDKLHIIENAKLTKSKQYQTGEDVLQKLENKHPIVNKILKYRGLYKLKSTYVDSFPLLVNPQTGRVHTLFNQTVTATGRLSSSNPNLQNIPIRTEEGKEIRKAFIAANEDFTILAADYSQIELRLVAALSQDENLLDAFFNGVDIHTATAARIYNTSIDQVNKDMRRNAKTVNFGILYGMSAFGLSDRLNIARKEAAELIDQYFDKYPKIRQYIDNQVEFAQKHGYVETIMKRRRYLRNINSSNANLRNFDQRNAINAPIQGSAADMIKIAMINVFNELKNNNLKSEIILQVHDELVLDVFKPELETVKEIVKRNMIGAINLIVPLEIDINTGNNWLEAH